MVHQITINKSVTVAGVNVYNGNRNTATFHPATEDSGIIFLVKKIRVPAKLEFSESRKKAIGLDTGEGKVCLVEHLLSAVYALGIDNLEIELSDGVCPTTDNCANEYFNALRDIRIAQTLPKRLWKYTVGGGSRIISDGKGKPDCLTINSIDGFVIDCSAYYPHKTVGEQRHRFQFGEEAYAECIANARPPGFMTNELCKKGFLWLGSMGFHGITEKNYLLITSRNAETYANPQEFGVRYEGEEFVRHKVLDVLGTLALTGRQFADTEFRFEMAGHRFVLYALKELFSNDCFESSST